VNSKGAISSNRTSTELLATLDAEASSFLLVSLVVEFENGDVFVFAGDPNRAACLEDALHRGGLATGLVGVKRGSDDRGGACYRVFPEYANAPNVSKYLEETSVLFASLYAAKN
jgi:hypothetical protein